MAQRLIAHFSQHCSVSDVRVTSARAIERFGIGGDQTTPDALHRAAAKLVNGEHAYRCTNCLHQAEIR